MKHPVNWLLALALFLAAGCRGNGPTQEKMPEGLRRDAFGRPMPPLLDPSTPPLVINPTQMSAAPANADWQLLDTLGGELDLDSATINFSPRSAHWRFSLTSEKTPRAMFRPNQDLSFVKVSLWIGEKDGNGNIALRPVKVNFSRKGGASCVQEFDNGLFPDGSSRPFQIMINGTYITYLAKVEDLGTPTPASAPKLGRSGE